MLVRILDANSNRAEEGLRVVEEYLRFVLEDRHLAAECKQLRHELAAVIAEIPLAERLAARESRQDVGTSVAVPDEYQRSSSRDVAQASQKRVEQALRCLEEYAKPLFPQVALAIEQLRYRAYALARVAEITATSLERLRDARLYVLIDGRNSADELDRFAAGLIEAGVQVLQLRDKTLNDRELLHRARALRQRTRGTPTLFVMNDRPDLAVLSDADGVHVGQEELTAKDARAIVGPARLVGVSTHHIEQARQAVLDGANYIGCGPTFPSETKSFAQFPGREFLRQVAQEIRLPAFAIGGITVENLGQVLDCGIERVAVSAAITKAEHPAAAAKAMLAQLRLGQ